MRLGLSFSLVHSAVDSLMGPHAPSHPGRRPVDPMEICPELLAAVGRIDRAQGF